MSVPIKREDIRKGDVIRKVSVFTAARNWGPLEGDTDTYVLVNRPVLLPSQPGAYESDQYPLARGFHPYHLSEDGRWTSDGKLVFDIRTEGALTLLRSVADVVAEVLAKMAARDDSGTGMAADRTAVAATYGVTL